MKAARIYGPREVHIEEIPCPGPLAPDEVLLRVELAALCGTDASQFNAPTMLPVDAPHPVTGRQLPLTLGHELVGTIVARGTGVQHLSLGQRVVPGSAWWCGSCEQCRAGRTSICRETYLHGIHTDGGLAEYARFPAKMCMPVPEHCPPEAAVLGQACAVALHALSRAAMCQGQTVALFGVGAIGSLLLAAWKASSPGVSLPVVAIDIDATRLSAAAANGAIVRVNASRTDPVAALLAITGGVGVDLAIEATGSSRCVAQALASLKRGGTLLQVGIPTTPLSLALGEAVQTEKTLITTNGQNTLTDLPRALHLLATTDLAGRIATQVIALDRLVEDGLLPLVEQRASAKIVVRLP